MSDDKKVFREGIIPEHLPPERTHARAKLIYRVFKTIAFMKRDKRVAALAEVKERNKELWDRVMHYLAHTTEEEIQFIKGPRPWFHDDGKLAIYHPIKDNPLLMKVYNGERPEDGGKTGAEKQLWLPKA